MIWAQRFQRRWVQWRRRKLRQRAVQEFRRSLALIVDLEALEASIAARLKEIFDPDRLVILRLDPLTATHWPSYASGFEAAPSDVAFAIRGRLARWFVVNKTCLLLPRDRSVSAYLDEIERRNLERLDVQLCAPLLAQNHLAGMLFLGASNPERRFGESDADLLSTLADQASLALRNAILYREQQERLDRLHRSERLAAMGQLAAGVAHEVRNPLTAIRSTMQYIGRTFAEGDPKRELVDEITGEVDRIDETISQLLGLSRADGFEPGAVDVATLLEQTIHLIEIQARKQDVALVAHCPHRPLELFADGQRLKQVFLNLIINALQAMPEGGRVTVEADLVTETDDGATRFARITIIDDGPGIPAGVLGKVFDPFFTTKSEGTGLGLSICHNIVKQHGGEIEIRSREGEGTSVTIYLPIAARGKPWPLS